MKSVTTSEERNYMSDGKLFHLIEEDKISHARLFAHVVLKPGMEVNYHEHHGEYEIYYILSGTGIYSDNGKECPVSAGCVTYCKSGNGHGIKPDGDSTLEFIALVIVD